MNKMAVGKHPRAPDSGPHPIWDLIPKMGLSGSIGGPYFMKPVSHGNASRGRCAACNVMGRITFYLHVMRERKRPPRAQTTPPLLMPQEF